jgi:hypothetical protein
MQIEKANTWGSTVLWVLWSKMSIDCKTCLQFILKSWWVAAAAICSLGLYEQGAKALQKEINTFRAEAESLSEKIRLAKELQEELKRQVMSQSDPAWIELVLIKSLGLVPEGYTKIYYTYTHNEAEK